MILIEAAQAKRLTRSDDADKYSPICNLNVHVYMLPKRLEEHENILLWYAAGVLPSLIAA